MNRRTFFKRLVGIVTSLPSLASIVLSTKLLPPIYPRRSLAYQSLGRKLLMVDELPQVALARYNVDNHAVAVINVEKLKKRRFKRC